MNAAVLIVILLWSVSILFCLITAISACFCWCCSFRRKWLLCAFTAMLIIVSILVTAAFAGQLHTVARGTQLIARGAVGVVAARVV